MTDNKLVEKIYTWSGNNRKYKFKLTEEQHEALSKLDGFSRIYWGKYIEFKNKEDENQIIVDGSHYMIEPKNTDFRGHSGREFKFEMIDGDNKGKIITTTNLWFQSAIPEELKEILTNNAKLIK